MTTIYIVHDIIFLLYIRYFMYICKLKPKRMQFKDIVGQRDVINRLTEIIDSGRISHAQLLLGDERDGSLQLAWAYMQYLCCRSRVHQEQGDLRADSCGECPECKKISRLMHPDLHFVFPNPPNGSPSVSSDDYMAEFHSFLLERQALGTLDDFNRYLDRDIKTTMIRESDAANVVRTLGMKPYEGGWRMLVIWRPSKMNKEAANELLKTLEEPLPQTLILLVDDSTEELLPTIVSRVQVVRLRSEAGERRVENAEFGPLLVDWLRMLFKLKMKELSGQVEKMAALGREEQKQFLQYALGVMRDCFLKSAAGLPCSLGSGDEKFDAMFPNMVTVNNIELINDALNDALFAIGRNAYGKIAFMELSFRISKALKKR